MKKKIGANFFFKLVMFTGVLFSSSAFSLPEDERQPAELEAKQMDYDAKSHLGIYEGDVHFSQGSRHLDADKAKTQFDDKNQLTYVIAISTTEVLAHFSGKMNKDDPEIHAFAKQIEYFPEKHLLILKDNASVTQGENKMQAPVIEYDIENHHVLTRATGGARTKLIIHSDKKVI